MKEPNYFSSQWSQPAAWYESLYQPRSPDVIRLDSSVSYTFPQHDSALERLEAASPDVKLIYVVRDPLVRLVSHYQLFQYYVRPGAWPSLEDAINRDPMFLGAGDYPKWVDKMQRLFSPDKILIIPFPLVTGDVEQALNVILPWLGIHEPVPAKNSESKSFKNEVRLLRFEKLSALQRRLHRSPWYPRIRHLVGADRLRALQRVLTKPVSRPSVEHELATLSAHKRAQLDNRVAGLSDAVAELIHKQDDRLGLDWTSAWLSHTHQRKGSQA